MYGLCYIFLFFFYYLFFFGFVFYKPLKCIKNHRWLVNCTKSSCGLIAASWPYLLPPTTVLVPWASVELPCFFCPPKSLAVSIVTCLTQPCSVPVLEAWWGGRLGKATAAMEALGSALSCRVHGAVLAPCAAPLLLPQLLQAVPGADLGVPALHHVDGQFCCPVCRKVRGL